MNGVQKQALRDHMDDDNGWILIVGFVFLIFFGGFGESSNYQVASYGTSKAIVLDVKTGEAWIAEESKYGETKTILLPVAYQGKQNDYKTNYYTPEHTKNDQNSSWWTFIKRKFNSKDSY